MIAPIRSASARYDQLHNSFIGAGLPAELVAELLKEYQENKRRYFLGDYGPAAINGGRFSEAVTRILQYIGTNAYTPLSESIKVDQALNRIEPNTQLTDGLRLHVVRALRLVYGIRNNRDNGHLRDGIDPNLQDATIVVSCMDWILAELVRVAHSVTPDEAQAAISGIVTREVPLIEEIEGRPIVLADLPRRDHVLVLLYWAGSGPTTISQLKDWLPDRIKRYVAGIVLTLTDSHLIHSTGEAVYLTRRGVRYVEENDLLGPL